MKVTYLDSIIAVDQWKAKNSRLFVLYVGVSICVSYLPPLYSSHFVIYSMAIKLLHAPATAEEINFANQLIHCYCKTAPLVYDPSIELFSLHAHLHLPTQTTVHRGLAFTSAFSLESCIRHIKKRCMEQNIWLVKLHIGLILNVLLKQQNLKFPHQLLLIKYN